MLPSAGMSPLVIPPSATPHGAAPAFLADLIDPRTRDYVAIDRGMDPIDAAVLEALATERDSGAAVQGFGQRFASHTHVDDALERDWQEQCALALAHLTNARQIVLRSAEVVTGDDWGELQVKYHNAATDEETNALLALSQQVLP